jgi:hypothetical protein
MKTVDLAIQCRCGQVRGVARDVGPRTVSHASCYCHDCRAFAHWLGREDLLDDHGGSILVQLARSRLEILEGRDQMRCMRLSDKGMYRWYAACCRSPLGNTITAIPFVGLAESAFALDQAGAKARFGPALAGWTSEAVGGRPPGPRFGVRGLLHVTRLVASWLIGRRGHPTPFFDRKNRPTVPPQVLSAAERQKLREHPRA